MMLYIGIDLGTSSCIGILTDREGNFILEKSVSYPVYTQNTNWSEQEQRDLDRATAEIIRFLSKGREAEIFGVGIAWQMHGLVILDENDEVISPAILWNDGRSEEESEYLNRTCDILSLTGNISFPGFTASKILWVKKHEPENSKRIRKICLPKDYDAYRLTGVFSTDYSDASGTLLLDVKNKCW